MPIVTSAQSDQTFRGRWITDLSASYKFTRFTLTSGLDNAFNITPDRNIAINSNSGIFQYTSFSPFGFNGRFVYARVAYRL